MADLNEKIYEVEIVFDKTCDSGAAIISDLGITLKQSNGSILVCYDTVNIKRNGDDFSDFNSHCREMTKEQLQGFWDTQVGIASKMIKRGVFAVSSFNSVTRDYIESIYGERESNGSTSSPVHDEDCPHYNG